MNTGDRIKQRRIELGLSVDDLAEKIGKSRATIYRYENGDIENIPTPILEPLAKALDTTPADLMGWTQHDKYFSGKEASSDIYKKFTNNRKLYHGKQNELQIIYEKLTSNNQDKVLHYSKNLLSNQQMEEELAAAHARTDITPTPEGQAHDNAIMDDDSEWE